MAAYFVVMQQVHDTDRYLNEYVPRVMPFLEKHGGEVLAAGFEGEALVGRSPELHHRDPVSRRRGSPSFSQRPRLPAGERAPVQHHVAWADGGYARVHAEQVTACFDADGKLLNVPVDWEADGTRP